MRDALTLKTGKGERWNVRRLFWRRVLRYIDSSGWRRSQVLPWTTTQRSHRGLWSPPALPLHVRKPSFGRMHPADQAPLIARSPLRYAWPGEPPGFPELHRAVELSVFFRRRAVARSAPLRRCPRRWTSHHSPLLLNAGPNEVICRLRPTEPCGVPGWFGRGIAGDRKSAFKADSRWLIQSQHHLLRRIGRFGLFSAPGDLFPAQRPVDRLQMDDPAIGKPGKVVLADRYHLLTNPAA